MATRLIGVALATAALLTLCVSGVTTKTYAQRNAHNDDAPPCSVILLQRATDELKAAEMRILELEKELAALAAAGAPAAAADAALPSIPSRCPPPPMAPACPPPSCPPVAAAATAAATAAAAVAASEASLAATLAASAASSSSPGLAPGAPAARKQPWYWTDVVMDALRPFEKLNGGITLHGLRLAEQKCKVSTWCHRAQVIDGRLYITDIRSIFFDRHYAMARIMPILLTMKRHHLPDLDAVFSGTDYPIMEVPRDAAHMKRLYGPKQAIPPLFAPTANTVSYDIPWPDFSFFPPLGACGKQCVHPLKTPRWQLAHPQLLALGQKIKWEEKLDRAHFTGNMKTSPNRRQIYNQAEHHPDLFFVNEVYIKTSPPNCFEINEPNVTQGGVLANRCSLNFEDMCRYKYLLNVGSNGYANKLKYLFLCGSVVIWVRKDSLNHEFFERHFVPGVHYAPVDTVDEVPDTIRRLKADDAYARSIALAGQSRMAQMDTDEVANFCASMLRGYAKLQRFKPQRDPRSWEVNCEDDLIRHYDRGGMIETRYVTQDNASCLRPPQPGAVLGPPGWGGAYAGSHSPCLASHDLSAKEEQGVCTPGTKMYNESGHFDGADWDVEEAYRGGALPDWSDEDPHISGKGARTHPFNHDAGTPC